MRLKGITSRPAAASAPWVAAWELEGADHIDFVFDTSTCGLACSFCRSGGADEAAVRAAIETLAVAFGHDWLTGGRLKVRFRAPARPGSTPGPSAIARKSSFGWTIGRREVVDRVRE